MPFSRTYKETSIGNFAVLFPRTNCVIRELGIPPIYSFLVDGCPFTYLYIDAGFLAIFIHID